MCTSTGPGKMPQRESARPQLVSEGQHTDHAPWPPPHPPGKLPGQHGRNTGSRLCDHTEVRADVPEANPQITPTPPHGPQIEGCNCQAWRTTGHPRPWPQAPQKAHRPRSNFKSHRKVPGPLQPNSNESAKSADSVKNIPLVPSWALYRGAGPACCCSCSHLTLTFQEKTWLPCLPSAR